jgi:hypothetical protein
MKIALGEHINTRKDTQMKAMDEEKSVLRWGGLAGILGAIIFVLVFVVVIGEPHELPLGLGRVRSHEHDIRAARTVADGLYLVVLILWVAHFLALYRALRGASLAPALFGSVLGIVGLGVQATGALPHVATAPISDLYHAPRSTPEDQATLVLMWQATEGIFDALFGAGLLLVPIGFIALGVAMLGAPAFGTGFSGVSVVLGVVGVVAASVLLVDPLSLSAFVGVLALIVFHLVVGWKVYSLSRAP